MRMLHLATTPLDATKSTHWSHQRCSDILISQLYSCVFWTSLSLNVNVVCVSAGAVVSSKGERGKPSRGTSEWRGRRELETLWSLSSFKWKQLHRPPVPYLFPASPSPLYPPSPYFPCHSVPTPLALSLSRSQCSPGYWRVKGMLQSYWLHNRLLIPLPPKNKRTCITTGGLRKSKKAVTMKLEYRGVNMKKYCLKQLLYSRFHKERILFQQSAVDRGNRSSERNLLIRKLFYFFLFFLFFLWCVFWDQGKEEKVNYADVKSERHRKHFIYKNRIWRIFMFFVFFFFFFL